MRFPLWPLAALSLLACNLLACRDSEYIVRTLQPNIVVAPTDLAYDPVVINEASQILTLQIANVGQTELEISDISVDGGGSGAFTVQNFEPISVAIDSNVVYNVIFAPTELGDYAEELVVYSNDPDAFAVPVPLTGIGRPAPVPDIELDATALDFGDIEPGKDKQLLLRVSNVGELDLHLDVVSQEGSGAFSLISELDGLVLSPGSVATTLVSYAPYNNLGDSAVLSISSDDPDEPVVTVDLTGNGGGSLNYPVAVLDCPTGIEPRQTVTLDASASYDPNLLEPLTYTWSLTREPTGSAATLTATDSTAEAWLDLAGTYTVSVVVTNTDGVDSAPAKCNLEATPVDDIHVELYWDTDHTDLDLHLADNGAELYQGVDDVSSCNRTPDWGVTGDLTDDPSLDLDEIDGYGPESISLDTPADGQYIVRVHYYEDNGILYGSGGGATNATVRFYIRGVLEEETTMMLTRNQMWDVGLIRWDSGYVILDEEAEPVAASHRSCWE